MDANIANRISKSPTLPVASYCMASILMTMTNKYVLSSPGYNMNFLLLTVQSLICVLTIRVLKNFKIITYRDFDFREAKFWFPISFLLVAMIYTSSKALQYLSVPVYTIFKNLTIIVIAYGEVLWFGGHVSALTLFSFGLMVLSSVVAAWADIQSSATSGYTSLNSGYSWMFLNCITNAAFVLTMRKRIKLTNFRDFDTMFYNNLLSIPILVVCTLFTENWSAENIAKNFPPDSKYNVLIAMAISGVSSVGISYTSAWCVRVTSSTTYSMVGALNKLPLAIAGLLFFNAPVTFGSVSAIFLGFISGIVYAVAKAQQQRKKESATVLPMTNNPVSASSQSIRDSMSKS
ncbi:GDP-mannose transporter Vrg4 [Schizosaccharomyces cryophilus OY26]|uniref:GDP-mannose transporter n=1 Tax=Schizosaccharomyces cryophilus (strain OY26 / ATCC MYA-4695 / CBS 11777 / NBRC 106824 / NRRL Y48691) TaxID=653667 RepID=S9X022_SCHCR|nr:GDP-mannose transporter Vrg4 [Schizosaccharomyces cryophilus OY26]EPY50302.1 GDP-mannose transporter Vrg4 [Schizosaccharomyces cryophilus OY26]